MRTLTCDLCEKAMFQEFGDRMYKVTVKRLKHSYDGYNPWVRKQNIEFCEDCGSALVAIAQDAQRLKASSGESLTSKKASTAQSGL